MIRSPRNPVSLREAICLRTQYPATKPRRYIIPYHRTWMGPREKMTGGIFRIGNHGPNSFKRHPLMSTFRFFHPLSSMGGYDLTGAVVASLLLLFFLH